MSENNDKPQPKTEQIELDAHRAIVMWLFIATFLLTISVAAALIYSDTTGKKVLTILPVVILAGVLGAFVSALNRIYSASEVFPIGKYTELLKEVNGYLIAYSSIPPLVGAISAAILYVAFAAEIATGPFFPAFSCGEGGNACNEFQTFLQYWSPDKAADYAKSIVWGFIAGFSERFVPDILNRVAKSSNEK
ncbi:MAG: hypothetical protein Q8L15_20610 [Methylobacter sp.]|nr:hypothetical protein [Methylobacter sp.]